MARGYYVSTVERDEKMIREYIRNQKAEDKRLYQLSPLKYAERYSNLSKGELERKFRNSSSIAEKMGIARVMKEKGYR